MKTGEIVGMEEFEEFSLSRSREFGKFLFPAAVCHSGTEQQR
jgi:hypothetical protein